MLERRRYPRIKKSFSLRLSGYNFKIKTETENLSANGMYCAINKPLELMTKLAIVIFLPYKNKNKTLVKRIDCEGVVVRKEALLKEKKPIYYIGVYFNNIKEDDREFLITYINSYINSKISNRKIYPSYTYS